MKPRMARILTILCSVFFFTSCFPAGGDKNRIGVAYCISEDQFTRSIGSDSVKSIYAQYLKIPEYNHFWHASINSNDTLFYVSVLQGENSAEAVNMLKTRFIRTYDYESDELGTFLWGAKNSGFLASALLYDTLVSNFLVIDYLSSDSILTSSIHSSKRISNIIRPCSD